MRPDRSRPLLAALAAFVLAIVFGVAASAPAGAQPASPPAKTPAAPANPWVFDASEPTVLRLDGTIAAGSADAFEAALAAHPGITTLVLRGDGASQAETIAIATRVRDLRLSTRIEAGDYCYLACGIVFLAGPERVAEGILCVAVLFADTVDLERAQLDLADFIELVMSFDLTPELLSSVVETSSGGAYCFSPHEIARFGVDAPVRNAPDGWNATPYAVLYEQPHEDAPEGTAWPSFTAVSHWSLEEGTNGPEIRLVAEVPDLGITVTVTIAADPAVTDRDNRGTLVTLRAETPEGFHGGGIGTLDALLSRVNEATAGIGGFYDARPTGNPGEFTVHVEGDLAWPFARVHFSRRWLSFILGYETGSRNELLIEVGEEGRAVIDQAYTAWDAMAPATPPARPAKQ
ncbi:MAG: hypothetical protein IT534_13490 [Bauldia sp.]|nr:hypothetical protein [Bauldia sp.]